MIETLSHQDAIAHDYAAFQDKRQSLSRLAVRLADLFARLGIAVRAEALAALRQKLDSDRFKVMVLGEFKRGKSTVINGLLGEEVLPMDVVPCTAVISEIKWGETRRAVLHFRHPPPPPPAPRLRPDVQAHIDRTGGGPVPPLEVSFQRLSDYVAIPDPGKSQADSVAASPFSLVEVFWPLELCRGGVEIIDSPGLNENITRARVAKNYVANVDAILFVMSCSAAASESELRVIDHDLRGVGHEYLFFILNRFDEIREADRPRIVEFVREKLAGRSKLAQGLFFVSARDALEGRMAGDPRRFESSGMAALEKELTRFLTQDRGRVKLLQPARELLFGTKDARDQILSQRAMLDESLAAIEAKIAVVKPQLEDAERHQRQIVKSIEQHREALRAQVRLETETFLRDLADGLHDWIMALKLDNEVTLFTFRQREQAAALAKEIDDKLKVHIEEASRAWSERTLEPLVQARAKAILAETQVQQQRFAAKIDQIRSTFSRMQVRSGAEIDEPSRGERIAAALVGGLLTYDFVGAAHGARFGFKGLGKSILTQLVVGLALVLVGVTNPFVLIGALLGFQGVRGIFTAQGLTKKAKETCAAALLEQLRTERPKTAQEIADELYRQTEDFAKAAGDGLEREIQVAREEMGAILKDKQRSQEEREDKRRLLDSAADEVREIQTSVEEQYFVLMGERRPRTAAAAQGGRR